MEIGKNIFLVLMFCIICMLRFPTRRINESN